jgi:hypothetical protein
MSSDRGAEELGRWAGRPAGRRIGVLVLAFALLQSVIALATVAFPAFHGRTGTYGLFHDVLVYRGYADRILAGETPYRDFTVEYPPGAVPLFVLPRLAAPGPGREWPYVAALDAIMLAFNAGCLWLVARRTAERRGVAEVPRSLAWYTAFFVACCPVAMARFDLAAMAIGFAAAYWLASGRAALGGASASLVALLKVFPGVVAAPALLRELARPRASRLRGLVSALIVFGLGVGAWLAVGGPAGVAATIKYHAERGLESGSLYAGLIRLAYRLRGVKVEMVFNHLSDHIETPLAMRLAPLTTLFQAAAVLVPLAAFARSGMRQDVRYGGACLLGCILFGKILSPQYLIWMIPFLASPEFRAARPVRWLFLAACVLTCLQYPLAVGAGLVLQNLRAAALLAIYGLLVLGRDAPDDIPAGRPAVDPDRGDPRGHGGVA